MATAAVHAPAFPEVTPALVAPAVLHNALAPAPQHATPANPLSPARWAAAIVNHAGSQGQSSSSRETASTTSLTARPPPQSMSNYAEDASASSPFGMAANVGTGQDHVAASTTIGQEERVLRGIPPSQSWPRRTEASAFDTQLPRLNAIRWSQIPDNASSQMSASQASISDGSSDGALSEARCASLPSMASSSASVGSSGSEKGQALRRFSLSALAAGKSAGAVAGKMIGKQGRAAVRSVTVGNAKSRESRVYARPEELQAARTAARAAAMPAAATAAVKHPAQQRPMRVQQQQQQQQQLRQQVPGSVPGALQLQQAMPIQLQRLGNVPPQQPHVSAPGSVQLQRPMAGSLADVRVQVPQTHQVRPGSQFLGHPGLPMMPPAQQTPSHQAQHQHARPVPVSHGQLPVQPMPAPSAHAMQMYCPPLQQALDTQGMIPALGHQGAQHPAAQNVAIVQQRQQPHGGCGYMQPLQIQQHPPAHNASVVQHLQQPLQLQLHPPAQNAPVVQQLQQLHGGGSMQQLQIQQQPALQLPMGHQQPQQQWAIGWAPNQMQQALPMTSCQPYMQAADWAPKSYPHIVPGVHRSVQSPAPMHNVPPRPMNAVSPAPVCCMPPDMDPCQVGRQLPNEAASPSRQAATALQPCLPPFVHPTHAQSMHGPPGTSAAIVSSQGLVSGHGMQPAGQAIAVQMGMPPSPSAGASSTPQQPLPPSVATLQQGVPPILAATAGDASLHQPPPLGSQPCDVGSASPNGLHQPAASAADAMQQADPLAGHLPGAPTPLGMQQSPQSQHQPAASAASCLHHANPAAGAASGANAPPVSQQHIGQFNQLSLTAGQHQPAAPVAFALQHVSPAAGAVSGTNPSLALQQNGQSSQPPSGVAQHQPAAQAASSLQHGSPAAGAVSVAIAPPALQQTGQPCQLSVSSGQLQPAAPAASASQQASPFGGAVSGTTTALAIPPSGQPSHSAVSSALQQAVPAVASAALHLASGTPGCMAPALPHLSTPAPSQNMLMPGAQQAYCAQPGIAQSFQGVHQSIAGMQQNLAVQPGMQQNLAVQPGMPLAPGPGPYAQQQQQQQQPQQQVIQMLMQQIQQLQQQQGHQQFSGPQFQGNTSAIGQLPQQSRPQAVQVAPAASGSQAGPLGSGLADLVSSFGQLAMQQHQQHQQPPHGGPSAGKPSWPYPREQGGIPMAPLQTNLHGTGLANFHSMAGANPGGSQDLMTASLNAARGSAQPPQATSFYQQSNTVQAYDADPQQVGPGDAYQAADTYQQVDTFAQAGAYQPDGTYEQVDVYQQVDQYQQVDASGQVQAYQQVDTYATDTVYDPNGNVVDQGAVAANMDTYSQTAVDADDDIGANYSGAADSGMVCSSDEPEFTDCGNDGGAGLDCGDAGEDVEPDLSLDFDTEDMCGGGTAGIIGSIFDICCNN